MSDYPTKLPIPHALLTYNAVITTLCRAGDKVHKQTSGVGDCISIPEGFPCEPLVTVQAYDLGRRENGPCWSWDYSADKGRGVWVIYDPDFHKVPVDLRDKLPVAEPESSLDISYLSKVDLSQSVDAPTADDFPDYDEDDEDSVLAG